MSADARTEPASRPRGRPRQTDPERRRQAVLEAAASLFARRGYDGASLRDIAAKARLSHAAIRHYFGSKSDLWDAAAEFLFGQMANGIAAALAEVDLSDPVARYEAQVRATVKTAARVPHLAGFTMQAGLAGGARYEALVERHLRPAYAFTLAPFRQLQAEGRTAPINPHFAFLISTNAAIGPFAQSANTRALAGMDLTDPAVTDAYADALIAVLSHGALRPARPC